MHFGQLKQAEAVQEMAIALAGCLSTWLRMAVQNLTCRTPRLASFAASAGGRDVADMVAKVLETKDASVCETSKTEMV